MGEEEAGKPAVEHAGIRTFLIADVRGYTLFTQERGDEAAAKLAARFAGVAREVVDDHGGSVIELRGDEALAVFESPRQAIRAATVLQRRFLDETEADPALPLPVGIGLDAGEAVPLERGYRGGALNLAARLCGRAGPGEILSSQGVVLLARKVEGVRLVDQGEAHLKGLDEPIRVFRVITEDGDDPAERFRRLAPAPARGSAPIRLMRRHPVLTALVALALVAAIAIPATSSLRGGGAGNLLEGDALAMVDLSTGELVGSIPLESRPGDVAVGAGGVWVTLPDRGAVMRIDPETMTVRNTIPVEADPSDIAVGEGSVWVTNGGSSSVSRISPETETVVQTIEHLPAGPAGIAVGDGAVWVANSLGASVSHIDAVSGEPVATIRVGDAPVDVALDERGVWVANEASGTISLIDPASDREVQAIPVGGTGPRAIAAGPDGVWVANFLAGNVAHIDPGTNAVDRAIPVGDSPTGLTLAGGSVWVSVASSGSVASIEPEGGTTTSTKLGSQTNDVAMGEGVLWVTVRDVETSHRGGTLTAWGPVDWMDSQDPALAYSALSWSVLALTNDGLVGFRHTGGLDSNTLVPDLARSLPEPTDGGTTYTFQLREGVRYSTGEPVRGEDFRRGIERVFANLDRDGNPSGGVPYFSGIVGADKCIRSLGTPCDLSSGIVADAGTVTFELSAPDPDFLFALTMPFAFAVPSESPDVLGDAETLPATGPYVIDRYEPGKEVALVRNPEFHTWSQAVRPDGFPDRVVWKLGSDQDAMVEDTLAGNADLVFAPPSDRIGELSSSHAGQLHLTPRANTVYMSLDNQTLPFDDVRVRQALNFAVDRSEVEALAGGEFRATCQILPPNLPGYAPYCPYTRHPNGTWAPNLARAQELVDASGTAGTTVIVWASEAANPVSVPIGGYFRDLLQQLGYHARLEVVGFNRWASALFGQPREAQITFVSWTSDYAAASGFVNPVLVCDAGYNETGFCDPAIDRRIVEATRLRATDPAAAGELWVKIEHDLVDEAPWVPLGTRDWVNLVSQRIGNYQSTPLGGPIIDQMWVR